MGEEQYEALSLSHPSSLSSLSLPPLSLLTQLLLGPCQDLPGGSPAGKQGLILASGLVVLPHELVNVGHVELD